MEDAIKTLVTTFLSSSRGKESLDSGSFNKLVKKQLGGIMENASCSSAVKEMQKGLDENQDGKINFPEYLSLIGSLATSYSEMKFGNGGDAS